MGTYHQASFGTRALKHEPEGRARAPEPHHRQTGPLGGASSAPRNKPVKFLASRHCFWIHCGVHGGLGEMKEMKGKEKGELEGHLLSARAGCLSLAGWHTCSKYGTAWRHVLSLAKLVIGSSPPKKSRQENAGRKKKRKKGRWGEMLYILIRYNQ